MSLINREDLIAEYDRVHVGDVGEPGGARKLMVDAPEVKPEPKWIPVSERLPDGQGFYLVSVGAPYKTVRVYEYKPCEWYENENLWKTEDGSYCFNWFVEAWMPLPEPYREEGDK